MDAGVWEVWCAPAAFLRVASSPLCPVAAVMRADSRASGWGTDQCLPPAREITGINPCQSNVIVVWWCVCVYLCMPVFVCVSACVCVCVGGWWGGVCVCGCV